MHTVAQDMVRPSEPRKDTLTTQRPASITEQLAELRALVIAQHEAHLRELAAIRAALGVINEA